MNIIYDQCRTEDILKLTITKSKIDIILRMLKVIFSPVEGSSYFDTSNKPDIVSNPPSYLLKLSDSAVKMAFFLSSKIGHFCCQPKKVYPKKIS